MRILLADWGTTMRGGQWQCLYLLRGLENLGVEVKLLARGELLKRAGRRAGVLALRRWSGWADLVHVQDSHSHSVATLASRSPVVVSRRVAFAVRQGIASRWKYKRAARFIAVSEHVAQVLEAAGVPRTKIDVVYDGVPVPDAAPPPMSLRPITLLGMQTGDAMKGDDLLSAAAARAGLDVHWSDRLEEDLPRALVFAYISRSEGLGSAALLAMANGTAVVASRVGGLVEAVEDGRTGLLADNDPDALAAALRRAVADAEQLGRCGREVAEDRFSVERMVQDTVEVYRRVLG